MTSDAVIGAVGSASPNGPAVNRPRRVVLKLSGEVFGGGAVGVDPNVVMSIARQIATVVRRGVQVAVVVGGGNFFRGAELQRSGMDRTAERPAAQRRIHVGAVERAVGGREVAALGR